MLVSRDSPEFGNRGELEPKVGAVISNLDAAVASVATMPVFHPRIPSAYGVARSLMMMFQSIQITLRHRGMGAMSFEHMVFQEEDLEPPRPEDRPDMIAQTPGQVIQSMRLATREHQVASWLLHGEAYATAQRGSVSEPHGHDERYQLPYH